LGLASRQLDALDDLTRYCAESLPGSSIYALLHRERDALFADEMFADLYCERGRNSVPPSVLAAVMVLQKLEGGSDRDAVERFQYDARWRFAAGVGGYDCSRWDTFSHTVLVNFRAKLAKSDRPRRVFEAALEAAREAGLVGVRRVLDSTPLYDAVATMDTITLIRSAVRGLLKVAGLADEAVAAQLRAAMSSGDDYALAAKPSIDWEDETARVELIDSRARDGYALLAVLDGLKLEGALDEAAQLLAQVLGQDLEQTEDGVFRIARRVAPDRIISAVDPEARHGHKTAERGFDGYKGHIAMDPDSEIITDTKATAGNVGDGEVAPDLLDDLVAAAGSDAGHGDAEKQAFGDNAYGTADNQEFLEENGIKSGFKTQAPTAQGGRFSKDDFDIDLEADTVTCPNGVTVVIKRRPGGDGEAEFGAACVGCPLFDLCTTSKRGRTIKIHKREAALSKARSRQKAAEWVAQYRANRPKVERKLAHLMRRRHGGRRARVRGRAKVDADFNLLAAATNLARLAVLGLHRARGRWAATTA